MITIKCIHNNSIYLNMPTKITVMKDKILIYWNFKKEVDTLFFHRSLNLYEIDNKEYKRLYSISVYNKYYKRYTFQTLDKNINKLFSVIFRVRTNIFNYIKQSNKG